MTLNFRFCRQQDDEQAVVDFLFSVKEDLALADRTAAAKVVSLAFDRGGIFAGYDQGGIKAMLGYFLGEPDRDFANKEVIFMYVAAIARPYRLTRAFHKGLTQALRDFQAMGCRGIRLQARKADPYTNKLYGRFAQLIAEGKSPRGDAVMTYGGRIEDALYYLERGRRKRPFAAAMNPTPHHFQLEVA